MQLLTRDVLSDGDEWGNASFVSTFTMAINLPRSAGVYGDYVARTISQLVETYGEEGFVALKATRRAKIGLSNMVDEDATWFSALLLDQATEVVQSSNA